MLKDNLISGIEFNIQNPFYFLIFKNNLKLVIQKSQTDKWKIQISISSGVKGVKSPLDRGN